MAVTEHGDQNLLAVRDDVWGELIACYGEGEDTDWPYLTDLCDLIVSMIVKHAPACITSTEATP